MTDGLDSLLLALTIVCTIGVLLLLAIFAQVNEGVRLMRMKRMKRRHKTRPRVDEDQADWWKN